MLGQEVIEDDLENQNEEQNSESKKKESSKHNRGDDASDHGSSVFSFNILEESIKQPISHDPKPTTHSKLDEAVEVPKTEGKSCNNYSPKIPFSASESSQTPQVGFKKVMTIYNCHPNSNSETSTKDASDKQEVG